MAVAETDAEKPTREVPTTKVGGSTQVKDRSDGAGPRRKRSGAGAADPRRAGLCKGEGGPRRKRSKTDVTGPRCARLRGRGEGPKEALSITESEDTEPTRDKPWAEAARPRRAGPCAGGEEPKRRKSEADVWGPKQARLRSGVEGPKSPASRTGALELGRVEPKANMELPALASDRADGAGPKWLGSDTDAAGLKRAGDLREGGEPGTALSVTGSRDTGPVRAMPKQDAAEPARARLRIEAEESKCEGSGTEIAGAG